jgi:hypothetical protein
VNAIALAGTKPVVASDLGVFVTSDGGATWLRLGNGLPQAPVLDIRYHKPTQTLHAATFGRGMWKLRLPVSFLGSAVQLSAP